MTPTEAEREKARELLAPFIFLEETGPMQANVFREVAEAIAAAICLPEARDAPKSAVLRFLEGKAAEAQAAGDLDAADMYGSAVLAINIHKHAHRTAVDTLAAARAQGWREAQTAERERCRDIVLFWLSDEQAERIVAEIMAGASREPFISRRSPPTRNAVVGLEAPDAGTARARHLKGDTDAT